ncbi:hypothetical protein DB30_06529 [Enhygromyxa salina]|uniref:Outer membrane protein beta-barrel domain-containing protein n=1 Tax=Enhygromyxa salina TaxID=215803 RepID=A0A0C2A6B5_9BACT|nr:hypothetical protein [Enhygromyxa salina]KIG18918.1 hypothetical protein DB30_06529 [Enhygromyxa salina]
MLPGLALASLLLTPPVGPEARLADLDHRRMEIHVGPRVYGRFLDAAPAVGASLQLGLGVRVVRGLYVTGELGAGAHALPVGVAAQGLLGVRHELRMFSWVRPSYSLGYTHLVEANFDGGADLDCGCGKSGDHGFSFDGMASTEIASRHGAQAGLGLRFPFRKAPRLSLYLRADASYYFDQRPGRLQAGGSLGLQVVF